MKLRIGLIGQGADWTTRYQPSLRLMTDRFDVRSVYSSVSALADQLRETSMPSEKMAFAR